MLKNLLPFRRENLLRSTANRITILFVFIALGMLSSPVMCQKRAVEIAPGVQFQQERLTGVAGPLVINILTIKMTEPGIHVETGIAQDIILADDATKGREAVAPLAKRHHAAAAVNADFFPFTGDPLNIAIRNGELLSEPMPHRVAMGITTSGKILFDTLLCAGSLTAADGNVQIDGINRLPVKDEITVLTPAFAARRRTPTTLITAEVANFEKPIHVNEDRAGNILRISDGEPDRPISAGTVILAGSGAGGKWLNDHLKPTESVHLKFLLAPNPLPDKPDAALFRNRTSELQAKGSSDTWSNVENAVGGGPWLVREGKQYVDGIAEAFNEMSFTQTRHPRTAVGVNKEGALLLVTIDGRQAFSRGTTLPETAEIMQRLGAVNAINLDGGGSASMVVKDLYVNSPSDGSPRPIADAILVLQNRSFPTNYSENRQFKTVKLTAGQEISLPDAWRAMGLGSTLPDWWGVENGTAFVDQAGSLFGFHSGSTRVIGIGPIIGKMDFQVEPAEAARIVPTIKLMGAPDLYRIDIVVTDIFQNPVPSVKVSVRAKGAPVENYSLTTDSTGKAHLDLTWPLELSEPLEVSMLNLPPKLLKRPSPKPTPQE